LDSLKIKKQSLKPKFELTGSVGTRIMGILNVTPDSFSDGGAFFETNTAIERALAMERDGADIIDVGGESTRPGARDVSVDEEMGRVIPVIEAITKLLGIPVSIDTRKSAVAEEAIKAGAAIINDVSGLKSDPKMASIAAKHNASVVIMHMRGSPHDMQANTAYKDVVRDVIAELQSSIDAAQQAGVSKDAIIIDPGIGFAKTAEQSIEILARLDEFKALERPICIGTSRKSFIGSIVGEADPGKRLAGTLATCAFAVMKGANILRVHDVKEVRAVVAVIENIAKAKAN
jgi:dihydropteroate synthase